MTVSSRPRHPVTGRRFWLRAKTPRELAAYLHRIEALRSELKLGMRTPEEVDRELRHLRYGPVTVERAARSYLERGLAETTRRRVRSAMAGHLKPLLPVPLAACDVPRLTRWIEAVAREGLRASSLGTLWRTLRAIGRHAAERGWIGALPWGSWRPRLRAPSARALREAARTPEELGQLLAGARALDDRAFTARRPRLPAVEAKIGCAALLGLRQGELAGLRWTDVTGGAGGAPLQVLVARQWTGAATKAAKAPVRIETIAELGIILLRHRARLELAELFDRAGPVFPAPAASTPGRPRAYAKGEVLTRLSLRAAVRLAHLPHVEAWSAHSLRDTFVTLEAAATGGDLRRVASRSRHASLASLVRYLRTHSRDPAPPAIVRLPASLDGDAGPPLLGSR